MPQPLTVPATLPMSVTLEAQQWGQILVALGKEAYYIAAPLVTTINQQLEQAASQPESGNGLDVSAAQPVENRVI